MAVTRVVASMTLKRPKTSAKRPDMMRPKMLCDGRVSAIAGENSSDALGQGCRDGGRAYLAALRMGRRYGDSVLETPLACPWRMMKLVGRKIPRKKKKLAIETNAKRISLKFETNSMTRNGLGTCLRRDFRNRLAIVSMPRIMKATARMVQGNPILGISWLIMMLHRSKQMPCFSLLPCEDPYG